MNLERVSPALATQLVSLIEDISFNMHGCPLTSLYDPFRLLKGF